MAKRPKPNDPFIARMEAKRQAEWEARLAGKVNGEAAKATSGKRSWWGRVALVWKWLPTFLLSVVSAG